MFDVLFGGNFEIIEEKLKLMKGFDVDYGNSE